MFEKEAEEYADRFWGASPSEMRAIEQAYQKGAEFGYNKAKKEIEEELLKCYQGYPRMAGGENK